MLGGSGAYASSAQIFLKIWCSLVGFGVYFEQIVFCKISTKLTLLLWVVLLPKKFKKHAQLMRFYYILHKNSIGHLL